jgi:hypothetical protein
MKMKWEDTRIVVSFNPNKYSAVVEIIDTRNNNKFQKIKIILDNIILFKISLLPDDILDKAWELQTEEVYLQKYCDRNAIISELSKIDYGYMLTDESPFPSEIYILHTESSIVMSIAALDARVE